MLQDLRYAARRLRQGRLWTVVVVASLALGIGANTALFGLVEAVLLRRLPVDRPAALVHLAWQSGPRGMHVNLTGSSHTDEGSGTHESTSFSTLAFERMRAGGGAIAGLFAFAPLTDANVQVEGAADLADGQFVSGNYFQALALPVRGRALTAADDHPSAPPAVVISDGFWQRQFARDPRALGSRLVVNGTAFTIVGITPAAFAGTLGFDFVTDFSIPLAFERVLRPGEESDRPWSWWLRIMGRLAPGKDRTAAHAELEGLFRTAALEGWLAAPSGSRSDAGERDVPRLLVRDGSRGVTDQVRYVSNLLVTLGAIAGILLLVVCINVASMVLARATDRHGELGLRLAMGASRARLMRLLLAESLLLSLVGGAVGVILALWGIDLLEALLVQTTGTRLDIHFDAGVPAFAAGLALLAGVAFGTLPALRASRIDIAANARAHAAGQAGSRSRLTRGLLAAQLATSLVLLLAAGLLVRSVRQLQRIDVGFETRDLLLVDVDPEAAGYTEPRTAALYERAIAGLEAVPGVRAATLADYPLVSGRGSGNMIVLGSSDPLPDGGAVRRLKVEPGFMQVMGLTVLRGRDFETRDNADAIPVALVNESLARRLPAGADPVGQRFDWGDTWRGGAVEIVGVVRDAAIDEVRSGTPPTVFLPSTQRVPESVTFSLRTNGPPLRYASAVRDVMRQLAPDLPLSGFRTQRQQIEAGFGRERVLARAALLFSVVSLLLACIGLYGLTAHSVVRRTREIGIRIALGAEPRRIIGLVLRDTAVVLASAVLVGTAAALLFARTLAGLLYGLRPHDPATLAAAIGALGAVALIAGYLPVRRATRMDPVAAIRHE